MGHGFISLMAAYFPQPSRAQTGSAESLSLTPSLFLDAHDAVTDLMRAHVHAGKCKPCT